MLEFLLLGLLLVYSDLCGRSNNPGMKSFMVLSQHVSLVNKTRHAVVLS